jgi:hypothetical protein
MSSTKLNFVLLSLLISALVQALAAQSGAARVSGSVLDPAARPIAGARIELDSASGTHQTAVSGSGGEYSVRLPAWGAYTVRVEAAGFAAVTQQFDLNAASGPLELRLNQVAAAAESVFVTAGVSEVTFTAPDPSQKLLVREELLDANPGRPGAPVSIPGLPIETAAGGIKAPQYFVPGVAGDHGEPIAQYIAVGSYLVSNNLSANAHGNGYADPNIYVSDMLGSVATDGGAFNVLEGNHALNLAATYNLRPQMSRFLTLTGDDRDIDLTAGFAPSDPAKREWVALEANYGNGLLKDMEHRQQYKGNALRVFSPGRHEITLAGIGYFGVSHEGNLVPIGFGRELNDTLDPRQKDQTHTGLLAANDLWKAGPSDELSFSGFFRTYNLALFSNFGEGLIRQSEFRTVEGGELRETHTFTPRLQSMAGLDYNEDDIHRDNLDHYPMADLRIYGSFVPVLSNNVTIRDLAPLVALDGGLGRHLRFYAGLRPDLIELENTDKLKPTYSFDEWKLIENPKVTLAWTPGTGPIHWLPSISFSIGQAYFTQDPRISVVTSTGVNRTGTTFIPVKNSHISAEDTSTTGAATLTSSFERSHSEQLVLEKEFSATDLRVTVGRTTTTATMAKIDPDNGSADDLGPGTLKFLTASVRHQFTGFGTLQAILSKADARLVASDTTPAQITPEAPRTIFDALATLDRLPAGLHARGEYEYVGHKQLDVGGFEAIPVGETRLAMVRSFLNRRLELGANGMLARGYTGQTTETFAPGWTMGTIPSCPLVSGTINDFDCGTIARSVGIRMVSWAGASISWRFNAEK